MQSSIKYYLLIAGDNYYPDSGDRDWRGCFDTREQAEAQVQKVTEYRTITKGKNKGQQEEAGRHYFINGRKYDWYDIIDLKRWIL